MSELTSCAFTGHRKIADAPDMKKLREIIVSLIDRGVTDFYCGLAVGFDMIAAELIISMKAEYPQLRLIGCVACEGQSRYFTRENVEKYNKILSLCDQVEVLSDRYFNGAMLVRNNFMVDRCAYLIAYLREETGGTVYTVRRAQSKNRTIFYI